MEISLTDFSISDQMSAWPDFSGYKEIRCDTGRTALRLALEDWQTKTDGRGQVWVPDYLCSSVFNVIKTQGIPFTVYIDLPGLHSMIKLPKPKDDDLVVIVHYFGKLNSFALGWLADNPLRRWRVLEDCVQSPYSKGVCMIGDYALTSLRKWWPAPDGAQLFTNKPLSYKPDLAPPDECFISQRLTAKILRSTIKNESQYLDLIHSSEEKLETSPPRNCSYFSARLLSCCDKQTALNHRRSNWQFINSHLNEVADQGDIFSSLYKTLLIDEVPLTYPIRVAKGRRNRLRAWLSERKIYCPIHWSVDASADVRSMTLSESILSLPIDQRYNEEDMARIVGELSCFV